MKNKIDVLDKGYVRLVDHMGSDLSVVNAARVSFAKDSSFYFVCMKCGSNYEEGIGVCENCGGYIEELLKMADKKLIAYLGKHGHTSPFRHAFMTFEIKAPLIVARQWWKYVVGSDHTMDAWNEVSRRYVQDDLEFYIPDVWRSAPDNKKQGSGGPIFQPTATMMTGVMKAQIESSLAAFQYAIEQDVCMEQARLLLPAYAMYTMWRWSASLQSVGHFLTQRLGDGAQWEIEQYATAVKELATPLYPESIAALTQNLLHS